METRPGIYRHYKGDLYRVLFTAHDSTNGKGPDIGKVVVYVSLSTGQINVRKEWEFHEWVLHPNEPRSIQRFEEQS